MSPETGSVKGMWMKSTRCESQQCVEAARTEGGMAIRDSVDPKVHIEFGAVAWRGFMDALKRGELTGVAA